MRHINIERAVLINGEHTEPGRVQVTAEMADYLVRQGCATAVEDAPEAEDEPKPSAKPRKGEKPAE